MNSMKQKLNSLQTRIFIAITTLVVIISIGLGGALIYQQTSSLKHELINNGQITARYLAFGSVLSVLVHNEEGVYSLLYKAVQDKDVLYAEVYDNEGTLIASASTDSKDGATAHEANQNVDAIPLPEGQNWVEARFNGENIYEFRLAVTNTTTKSAESLFLDEEAQEIEETIGWVHVGISTHRIEDAINQAVRSGLMVLLLLIVLALMLGWRLSLNLTKRLAHMSGVIGEIRGGAVDKRIHISGEDEIALLALSFNNMLDDLKARSAELETERITIKTILDQAPESIFLLDQSGHILDANPAAAHLFGYSSSEWNSLTVHDLVPEDVASEHKQWFFEELNEGRSKVIGRLTEVSARRKDGSTFPCSLSVNRFELHEHIRLSVFLRDLTKQKEEEEKRIQEEKQMEHVQRLESLGVLAGGIAHDFNNILSAIMGNATMAERKVQVDPIRAKEHLSTIVSSSEKAALLCRQMLAYSGKGQFIIKPVNLSSMVSEITSLLEVSIARNIEMVLNLADELPLIEADESQIQQVIMNMVINASEAIGDKQGRIGIATGTMYVDVDYLSNAIFSGASSEVKEGNYVFLEVYDNGCGMSRKTQKKIFEPFFTTKFTGRGLGMSAIQGIMRGHHGIIQLYSELGKGTTFKLLFPALSGQETKSTDVVTDKSDYSWQPSGTILIVDDEETIRETAECMLKDMGFDVITAVDGVDGIEQYQRHRNEIVAVLLDMTMPRLDGIGCYRELQRIDEHVTVIISSGYSEDEAMGRFRGEGVAGFVQKPYLPEVLEKTLRHVVAPEMWDSFRIQ